MKTCSKCRLDKPESEFGKKGSGLQPWCRSCNAIRSRQYYSENKEKHRRVVIERNKKIKKENQQKFLEYLRTHPCVDCGVDDLVVLELDHLRDKEHNVTTMFSGYSWNRILKEINKCEVVCANCHRRRTFTRCDSYRTRIVSSKEEQ